jgi:hypothetical protein
LNVLIEAVTAPPDAQIDPRKLSDSDWAVMETAAKTLRDQFARLRDGKIQAVAAPGDKLYEEELPGMPNAHDVQANIQANLVGFRNHAEKERLMMEDWLQAIHARDARSTWKLALDLDESCTECHDVFWSGEPESGR